MPKKNGLHLNSARALLGRHVNLHLRDGSVIVARATFSRLLEECVSMGKSVRKRASSVRVERCQNPWNGQCRNTDIEVYIMYRGKRLPICRRCWSLLGEKPVEWGDSSPAKALGR